MILFGLVSSVFDYLTFGVLLDHPSWYSGSIQSRLVSGVRCFSIIDCACYSKPKTFLQEQTVEISVINIALQEINK